MRNRSFSPLNQWLDAAKRDGEGGREISAAVCFGMRLALVFGLAFVLAGVEATVAGRVYLACRSSVDPDIDEPLLGVNVTLGMKNGQRLQQETTPSGFRFSVEPNASEWLLFQSGTTIDRTIDLANGYFPLAVFLDYIPRRHNDTFYFVLRGGGSGDNNGLSESPWGCTVYGHRNEMCSRQHDTFLVGAHSLPCSSFPQWINRHGDKLGPETTVWQRMVSPGSYNYWAINTSTERPLEVSVVDHRGCLFRGFSRAPLAHYWWIASLEITTDRRYRWTFPNSYHTTTASTSTTATSTTATTAASEPSSSTWNGWDWLLVAIIVIIVVLIIAACFWYWLYPESDIAWISIQ